VSLPAAILAGANVPTAMPIIRSLAGAGVNVYLLSDAGAAPAFSRYAHRLPIDGGDSAGDAWARYLLGSEAESLRGSVLLACNDDAVEMLLDYRDRLAEKYVLDLCNPEAQRWMLDKLSTYEKAAEAGIPTPRFWRAASEEQVLAQRDDFVYPLLVKPLHSHRFKKVMTGKYRVAHDFDELLTEYGDVIEHGLEVVLVEMIPGPDDLLCSYYTYLDDDGSPRFHFTKRILRRHPEHEGPASYHITDWNPDVRELGLKLFGHVGLKGVANVEFKRDPRDGMLKVIECNARFTLGNPLLAASGYDLGRFVYNRLVGLPQPPLADQPYVRGLRLWFPIQDFLAFLDLRRDGRLTLAGWLRSILHRQVLPMWALSDPLPSLVATSGRLRTAVAEVLRDSRRRRSP
jgi:predicted ATP-grasp superfamily ATP-dependent carboligase